MIKPLLIEILTEELPAIPFLKELPNIEKKWLDILQKHSLGAGFEFYYTPRRVLLWHPEFKTSQTDTAEEFFGAPLQSAFVDGKPTAAALGFAKKCGVEVEELGTAQKGGKEVLYFNKQNRGQKSSKILSSMVDEFVKSLNFGKSMRWGAKDSFIRPIRSFCMMLGDEVVEGDIFGVSSSASTFVHRNVSYNLISFETIQGYFDLLKKSGVVLSQHERQELIEQGIESLENGISVQKDSELLAEVVAITEAPTVLIGSFDEKFLTLPKEVIITSMKENQRYFPVFKDGKLSNQFVFVSNALTSECDLIIHGNEKVLRARLEDALFFWENDLKNGLSNEGLKKVVYMDGLGSLHDKSVREQKIGSYLARKYFERLKSEKPELQDREILNLLDRTIGLAKADLLSEMVYEFTELQGLMGYYYALQNNQDELLALSFKEQYLPNSEDSPLPSTVFSSIVALSNKLDSLMALFSVGKIPSGTKDPFALRRAVNGVVKIVLEYELEFDFKADFMALLENYNEFNPALLEAFFIDRLYQFFDANPSIIKAVLNSGERDIVRLYRKIEALKSLTSSDEFKENFSTFKRVSNIIKDVEFVGEVDEALFEKDEERALFGAFGKVKDKSYINYEERLDALFGLKTQIDNFFDKVIVNAEDTKAKANRTALLYAIYKEFLVVADIKDITI